jgi:hypothetical protein
MRRPSCGGSGRHSTTEAPCRTAGDLAERDRWRGFDMVHLASFVEVARRARHREARFSSFDDHLAKAKELAWPLRRHS